MSDGHLILRLKDGVVEREKRWQGDTHDDLGGWVDDAATDELMTEAAAEITRLRAELDAWCDVANRSAILLKRVDDARIAALTALAAYKETEE